MRVLFTVAHLSVMLALVAADVVAQERPDARAVAMAAEMKRGGARAQEVAEALREQLRQTPGQTAAALQSVDYEAIQTALALSGAFKIGAVAGAGMLLGVGYSVDQAVGALVESWGASTGDVAAHLVRTGVRTDAIARAQLSVLGLAPRAAAAELLGAGASVSDVTSAVARTFGVLAAQLASDMLEAGAAPQEVAGAVAGEYGLTVEQVVDVLMGVGLSLPDAVIAAVDGDVASLDGGLTVMGGRNAPAADYVAALTGLGVLSAAPSPAEITMAVASMAGANIDFAITVAVLVIAVPFLLATGPLTASRLAAITAVVTSSVSVGWLLEDVAEALIQEGVPELTVAEGLRETGLAPVELGPLFAGPLGWDAEEVAEYMTEHTDDLRGSIDALRAGFGLGISTILEMMALQTQSHQALAAAGWESEGGSMTGSAFVEAALAAGLDAEAVLTWYVGEESALQGPTASAFQALLSRMSVRTVADIMFAQSVAVAFATAALAGAGVSAQDLGPVLEQSYGLGAAQVASALHGAQFTLADILDTLVTHMNVQASAAQAIVAGLGG